MKIDSYRSPRFRRWATWACRLVLALFGPVLVLAFDLLARGAPTVAASLLLGALGAVLWVGDRLWPWSGDHSRNRWIRDRWQSGTFVRVHPDHPNRFRAGFDGMVVADNRDGTVGLTFYRDRYNQAQRQRNGAYLECVGTELWHKHELDPTSVEAPREMASSL